MGIAKFSTVAKACAGPMLNAQQTHLRFLLWMFIRKKTRRDCK